MFLFFGIVAVAGSFFVQVRHLNWEAFALAVPVGLLAAAILVVNNVRDIDSDRRAGKRTLAVRLGPRADPRAVRRGRLSRLPAGARDLAVRADDGLGAAALADAAAGHRAWCGSCAPTPTGRRSTARWPRAGCCSSPSACCSRPGCCSAGDSCEPHVTTDDASRCGRRSRPGTGRSPSASCCSSALEAADGSTGHGEAAPLESYDGVRRPTCAPALEDCRPVLAR